MFFFLVQGMIYSTMYPLILPFVAVYFLLGYVTSKYNLGKFVNTYANVTWHCHYRFNLKFILNFFRFDFVSVCIFSWRTRTANDYGSSEHHVVVSVVVSNCNGCCTGSEGKRERGERDSEKGDHHKLCLFFSVAFRTRCKHHHPYHYYVYFQVVLQPPLLQTVALHAHRLMPCTHNTCHTTRH